MSPTNSSQHYDLLPAISVADNRFDDFEIPLSSGLSIQQQKQQKPCYRGKSIKSKTSELVKPSSEFDYLQQQIKPKIIAQKSAPSPLFFNSTPVDLEGQSEMISLSPIETIHLLRDTMNIRLDQLIAQIYAIHEEKNKTDSCGTIRVSEDTTSSLLQTTTPRAHMPLSAPPAHNFPLSHVSFSSFKTYKEH